MSNDNLPSFIRALLEPEIYPHQAENIKLIQTHISFVTVAGSYVYKWKKPVDFGFLNFSTLEKREFFCRKELELNRRLCPDLYLEVVEIAKDEQGFHLGSKEAGSGEIVEYGLKMKRMDEGGMMSRRIADGSLGKAELDALVKVLVPFYEKADCSSTIDHYGTADGFGVNVIENFEQTENFIGQGGLTRELFDYVKDYSMNFLADRELFEARIKAGKIRDCHGDLYSANICFDGDKVYVFDCIEFNERFRYSDAAADIAFLAMDLDFHGLEHLSEYFVAAYREASGDDGIADVLDFYKCYRAYVRAKIGLFTASDPVVDEQTAKKCLTDAAKYFSLARRYAGGK
ncbi:MAG: hypothetical protein CSB24_00855 [Deltaproteobacteria bacterium]|nr:MAG: hypothetical protein CSB24_00855 [Deltaproteobacteria bacterium]